MGRTEGPGSEMDRKSLLGECPHRIQGLGTLPSSPSPSHSPSSATPLQQLCCPQGTQSQQLALSFLQEETQVGPSQRAFQTGVWEEAEGPAEGPSVPAVPATCTHSEDKPQGSRMKRWTPRASTSAWGCQETAMEGGRGGSGERQASVDTPGAGLRFTNCQRHHWSLGLSCPSRKGFLWLRLCPSLVTDSLRD